MIIVATYVTILRNFLRRHWKTITTWFLASTSLAIVTTVAYYTRLHYFVLNLIFQIGFRTAKHLMPAYFQLIWNLISVPLVVYLIFRSRKPIKQSPRQSPLVLVQNVENQASLTQEMKNLRRDLDRLYDCFLRGPTVAAVQNHHRNQHRIKAQSQNTAPETPSASEIVTRALEEPVVMDDADEVTPSPVPEFEMPDASPTPLKRPHPTPDVQDTQIKPSPSPEPTPVTLPITNPEQPIDNRCETCGRKGNHTCWQRVKARTCWMCRQKTKQVTTSYVNDRGNVVSSEKHTPCETSLEKLLAQLNRHLNDAKRREQVQNADEDSSTRQLVPVQASDPNAEPREPPQSESSTGIVNQNFGRTPPQA